MTAYLQAGHVAFMIKVYDACKFAEQHLVAQLDENSQIKLDLGIWRLVYKGKQVRTNEDLFLFIKEVHEFYLGDKDVD